MSRWEVGWAIYLAGLPWAHFLFRWAPKFDLSHATGTWGLFGLLGLWAVSLNTARSRKPLGWSLTCLTVWLLILTAWLWLKGVIGYQQYPILALLGPINLLVLLLGLQTMGATLTLKSFELLSRWIARSGVLVMAYSILQLLNLDQFFRPIDHEKTVEFVGLLGNPSTYGAYLALLLPFLLLQQGWRWRLASVGCGVLCLRTGSASAVATATVVGLWWGWHRVPSVKRRLLLITGILLGVAVGVGMLWHADWLNPSGRLTVWKEFWTIYAQGKPVTGEGAGFIWNLSRTLQPPHPLATWRHVHNEYFQVLIEWGVIGAGLLAWVIGDFIGKVWKLTKSPDVVAALGVLMAFGLLSLVTFPAHVWSMGTLALLAYGHCLLKSQEELCLS